jgi:hypothetical protein
LAPNFQLITYPKNGGEDKMINHELIGKPEMVFRNYQMAEPKQKESARDRISRGPTALIVLLLDLLVKLDPR